MGQGADNTPLQLRDLKRKLEDLNREEAELAHQRDFFKLEIPKQKKAIRDLEKSITRVDQTFVELSKSPIVSLDEYKQLRMINPVNRTLLTRMSKKLRDDMEANLTILSRIKQIPIDREKLERVVLSWNKIIEFKR